MSANKPNDRFADYIPVAERLEKFYQEYPQGRVITKIIEHDQAGGFILMRAEVYRSPDDAQPAATGHAFEVRGESYVNKTSYVENCETGCVGRALALLGFEVKRGVASREEMQKAGRMVEPASVTVIKTKPSGKLDSDIMQALDILNKSHDSLTEWVQKKYKDHKAEWFKLSDERKEEVLSILQSKVDEQNAAAR
jgi:hypothetical protein